jgi:hypothetical protein
MCKADILLAMYGYGMYVSFMDDSKIVLLTFTIIFKVLAIITI